MQFQKIGDDYIVRISKGELLMESLLRFVNEQGVTAAWVQGLGGAQWAELGFYHLDSQHYEWKRFDELLEITSLQGNIAQNNGETVLHVHGVFGTGSFGAITGHVKEVLIAGTCELLVTAYTNTVLNRKLDDGVGLPLLDL